MKSVVSDIVIVCRVMREYQDDFCHRLLASSSSAGAAPIGSIDPELASASAIHGLLFSCPGADAYSANIPSTLLNCILPSNDVFLMKPEDDTAWPVSLHVVIYRGAHDTI
jgi:hypothetical protein